MNLKLYFHFFLVISWPKKRQVAKLKVQSSWCSITWIYIYIRQSHVSYPIYNLTFLLFWSFCMVPIRNRIISIIIWYSSIKILNKKHQFKYYKWYVTQWYSRAKLRGLANKYLYFKGRMWRSVFGMKHNFLKSSFWTLFLHCFVFFLFKLN